MLAVCLYDMEEMLRKEYEEAEASMTKVKKLKKSKQEVDRTSDAGLSSLQTKRKGRNKEQLDAVIGSEELAMV